MIKIKSFTFNPFSENTYVLYDETKECVIIDPGCYDKAEQDELTTFITNEKLTPVKLLNTHCHIDHVFANKFVKEKYKIDLEINKHELVILQNLLNVAHLYGVNAEESPMPERFIDEGNIIKFGDSELTLLFTPGHSPGSICFVNTQQKFIISGDVLFYRSIGRTDLPGGSYTALINSIKTKLFALADDIKVYPGHGEPTTIGYEKVNNPFLL